MCESGSSSKQLSCLYTGTLVRESACWPSAWVSATLHVGGNRTFTQSKKKRKKKERLDRQCTLLQSILTKIRKRTDRCNKIQIHMQFGIHFHKTLDTAQPCHLLIPNEKPSSSHSISTPTNINTQFLL